VEERIVAPEVESIANQVADAIKSRDVAKLDELYHPDVVIWHAATGQVISRSDALAMSAAVFNATSELGYRNVRRHPIEGGFIQQHQLVGRLADGTQIPPVEICMIIKVRDGKLISTEEYFDLSKLSAAFALA
jgi:limonene-1,2-epoxide hydrolase